MRRTEAIKLLQEIILEHMNCATNCCSTDDQLYDKILSEIETKIGMRPARLPEAHIQALTNVYVFSNSYQWEEDFEKNEIATEELRKNPTYPRFPKKRTNDTE